MKHACTLTALVCCFLTPARSLGFGSWQAQAPGRVVESGPDWVSVSYDSSEFKPIVVCPAVALPLPPGVRRIRAWYARRAGDFDLVFLVQDGAGTTHRVKTRTSRGTFPGIRRFKLREWSMWNQVESICLKTPTLGEVEVQPEYLPVAERSIWPEPLSLVGVEVQPARDRRDNAAYPEQDVIRAGKGSLCLTGLDFRIEDGFQAEYSWYLQGRWRWGWDVVPRLFFDDLTRQSGTLWFALDLRQGYQGQLVWQHAIPANLDRQKPMDLFGQRIELPPLPPGRYVLTTKAWLADGTLDATRRMELHVAKGRARPLPTLVPALRWSTGQKDHVFPADTEKAELLLQVAEAAWPPGVRCFVAVTDWLQRPIAERQFDSGTMLRIPCAGLAEGTDYAAVAEWRQGPRVLDRAELHFGVASRAAVAGPIPPDLPSRDDLLMSGRATAIAEHWGSLLATRHDWEPITEARAHEFDAWLEQVDSLGFKVISLAFGWGEIEPLPGVFRWREIERRVAAAGAKGMHVLLTPTEWGHPLEYPQWVELAPMVDQFGRISVASRTGHARPSVLDPLREREHRHWLRAVARRFRGNPAVVGYRTKPFIYGAENRPEVARTDYAPPMQAGFRRWLRDKGLPAQGIPRLFALYSWSAARTGPDLSPGWVEFTHFRTQCYVESVRRIMATIRSVDPYRQVHIYRSSVPMACEAAIPLLKDGGEFHDEGGPFYFQRAIESMCLQAGVPYTNEGHQFTPPSKGMVDAGFFYGSCYDRGWGWLYRWHSQRHEDKRFVALPEVLQFIQDGMPALNEWVSAKGDQPEVLVFGSRADKLLDAGRHGFYSDIAGVDLFTALFSYHQLPAHFANEHTDWVDLARFKLVFVRGRVMTEAAMDRVVRFAAAGGKIVLVGESGQYCVERPGERHPLRQRLADLPNVKRLDEPSRKPPAPGPAYTSSLDFDDRELGEVLAWAGVGRRVHAESQGFECLRKQSRDGRQVYVALFRRYPGQYGNIWYDKQALERWGWAATTVTVPGLPEGRWHIEKFHREARDLGVATTRGGVLTFQAEPAAVAELQLFRLTPEKPQDR